LSYQGEVVEHSVVGGFRVYVIAIFNLP